MEIIGSGVIKEGERIEIAPGRVIVPNASVPGDTVVFYVKGEIIATLNYGPSKAMTEALERFDEVHAHPIKVIELMVFSAIKQATNEIMGVECDCAGCKANRELGRHGNRTVH